MLNNCTLMGRLVKDPELRKTGNKTEVVNFTIAVERNYTNADDEREVDFIDCVAWRGTAKFIADYFEKGRMIIVNGELNIRKWEDDDGNKRRNAEITVISAYFGDSKKDTEDSKKKNKKR